MMKTFSGWFLSYEEDVYFIFIVWLHVGHKSGRGVDRLVN